MSIVEVGSPKLPYHHPSVMHGLQNDQLTLPPALETSPPADRMSNYPL